ncbi:MAG: MEDS domain-containing protein, partial [Candidatus Bathyarchaeota archaeon]
ETQRLFTFNDLVECATPNFSTIEFQRRRWNRSIPSNLLNSGPVLDVRERDSVIATYTSAADKMKVFSAFIRDGLESGDAVWYTYPDEENETVRAKLEEYGVDVEEYEEDGTLHMMSQTEEFMPNGKLDFEKDITDLLNFWSEAKRRKYKHVRVLGDMGDFSFVNGQWQKYVKDYWLDPRWNNPNVSEWVEVRGPAGIMYKPFLMEITAINVEHMSEAQVRDIIKAFGRTEYRPTRFIDLLEYVDVFSKRIGLSHQELIGRKFLLEFDPTSEYETIVEDFAREFIANVEPIYVFTSAISSLNKRLSKLKSVKFLLMSASTSTIQSISENEVLVPANNIDLILGSVDSVAKTYSNGNVSLVFDGLSDLLSSLSPERTFAFLRQTLQKLSSEKMTSLFLFNTGAHEAEVVSRLRNLFSSQLAYDKNGLETTKISQF